MVASFASASTNSTRANTEATKYRTDFEKRVKAAINKVIPAFDKSASDAEASYRLQRKALYAQCTALGSDGVTLGAKYETAIKVYEYAIPSLVNKTTLKANITKILADFNTNIFSPATKNITAMVAAISKYPKAIACWDDNSNDVHLQEDTKAFSLENVISYIISSTAQYIQSSIDELSYYLNMLADEAQTQCTTDKKCKLAYVSIRIYLADSATRGAPRDAPKGRLGITLTRSPG